MNVSICTFSTCTYMYIMGMYVCEWVRAHDESWAPRFMCVFAYDFVVYMLVMCMNVSIYTFSTCTYMYIMGMYVCEWVRAHDESWAPRFMCVFAYDFVVYMLVMCMNVSIYTFSTCTYMYIMGMYVCEWVRAHDESWAPRFMCVFAYDFVVYMLVMCMNVSIYTFSTCTYMYIMGMYVCEWVRAHDESWAPRFMCVFAYDFVVYMLVMCMNVSIYTFNTCMYIMGMYVHVCAWVRAHDELWDPKFMCAFACVYVTLWFIC